MKSDSFDNDAKDMEMTEGGAVTARPSALPLDADKYRPYVVDFDLTDAQQIELLQTLWSIMRSFVEIGFGVDSIHHFIPALGAIAADPKSDAVESKDNKHTSAFQRVAGNGPARKEES